ncbi:hypothetical protein QJQ45_028003, partial [Haematococcus lacustris]
SILNIRSSCYGRSVGPAAALPTAPAAPCLVLMLLVLRLLERIPAVAEGAGVRAEVVPMSGWAAVGRLEGPPVGGSSRRYERGAQRRAHELTKFNAGFNAVSGHISAICPFEAHWLVKAMVDKKRGVKANCANVQKAREVTAQRRAAEAAGPIEIGAQAGVIAAEAQAQAVAGAQLHQLQADLQHRELQLAHNQRMQQLQQQLQDLQRSELQRKEQQLADLVAQQRAALLQWEHQLTQRQHQLQQQQVDLSRREQDLTERKHQLQHQQAHLDSREQQQARTQTLTQQLHSLQQELKAQQVAEEQREVQQQLAAPRGAAAADRPATKQTAGGEAAFGLFAGYQQQPPPPRPFSMLSHKVGKPTSRRVQFAAPTVLTSNRFATLHVADEPEQLPPSKPAELDEYQAVAAAIAAAAVGAVLRAAVEAEGQGQQDGLQQHRRMRSVVSLATGVVPPTPDQVLGGIMVDSLRPVLAGIKPAPGGQRSTNQQPFNTALIMTMGRGIEQHGIKRTARQLGITPHAVKRARRSHLSNLAAGAAADWAAAPLQRGRRCLSQEQLEYVRSFFEDHSSPSPMYKDVRRYYVRMTAG